MPPLKMKKQKEQNIEEVPGKKNSKRELKKIEKKNKRIKRKTRRRKKFAKIRKIIDSEDKETLKGVLFYVCLYGPLINFSLWVIFGMKFTLYSWIAWGLAVWVIENKFVGILRKMIKK